MTQDTERKILNFPQPGAEKPEQAGPEFYDAGSRPEQPMRPDYKRDEHADAVKDNILRPEFGKPAEPLPGMHKEAGIPLPDVIKSEKEKAAAMERLIARTDLTPDQLQKEFEKLYNAAA